MIVNPETIRPMLLHPMTMRLIFKDGGPDDRTEAIMSGGGGGFSADNGPTGLRRVFYRVLARFTRAGR